MFGADRFAFDAGGWRVLGINAQLLGYGLPQEAEQDAWLDAELGAASQRCCCPAQAIVPALSG